MTTVYAFLGLFISFLTFATPVLAQVTITSPAANATVSGTVIFNCTDSAANSKVGVYIDSKYVSTAPYSWNTTAVTNGSHYLICDGYVGNALNGSVTENVTVRNPASAPTPTTSGTSEPTATPTNSAASGACASTIDVFCTGHSDSPALQSAMNCPGSIVRPHGACDVNKALVGTNIGYDGTDATLNVESSVAPGVTLATGANSYTSLPWTHLKMTGSSATGLLLGGNFTQINMPSISGFANNILIGTNGYLDTINAPTIWNGGTGINCPIASNAGEGIVVIGGEIFNLATGSYNSGCGLTFIGTHFDGITGTPLVLNEGSNGASTDCTNCYIELMAQPSSGVAMSLTGYNAFGSIEWIGGQIQQDNYNTPTALLKLINNGGASLAPYIRVSNARLYSLTFSGLSSNPNVALCADTSLSGGGRIGNIPNSGICP